MRNPANQRIEFDFEAVALAGHTCTLHLSPPADPEEGSWVSPIRPNVLNPTVPEGAIQVPCSALAELMAKRGHQEVDLLKIDIEGAEYDVLDAILHSSTRIRQIAFEFHNGVLPCINRSATIAALIRLYCSGYRFIHKGGSNHSLMRSDCL